MNYEVERWQRQGWCKGSRFYASRYVSNCLVSGWLWPPRAGDRIAAIHADSEFEAIVVDPNGLDKGQPSFGQGFNRLRNTLEFRKQTLTDRVTGKGVDKYLKKLSGRAFRITGIFGTNSNNYTVIEAGDWFDLVIDILVHSGKNRRAIGSYL